MKLTLWLISFLTFAAVNAVAADLTYSIAIRAGEGEIGEVLLSEQFWKSFGGKVPFKIDEQETIKLAEIKEGTTGTLELGPAKLHLKLMPGPGYEFLLTTEDWDPQKMHFPDPANARLRVTVDSERGFTLLIIECTGLPEGLPKMGEKGMSQVLTIFASNLKTLIETGKPMFDVSERPKREKSAPPKPCPPTARKKSRYRMIPPASPPR
jgi:hypothetical protein